MKRGFFALVLCIFWSMLLMTASASGQTACAPPWQAGMSVVTGQMVSFTGDNWKAIQPEASASPDWQPPNVPALWSLVGPCQGSGGGSCTSVPSAPTGLGASNVTQTGATLNWTGVTPPTNCTITSYNVSQNGTSIGTTSSTSFAITGLSPGGMFSFSVAASDAAGISTQSAPFSVTTPANTCKTVPGVPTGLSASSTTSTGTVLSWAAPAVSAGCTITSYTIFENGASAGTVTGTNFTVTGLQPATAFSFTVAANDGAGASAQSGAISVTTAKQTAGGNGRLLIGYWHDFDNGSVDLPLAKVSTNFDVIIVAFGGTTNDTSTISFEVDAAHIESQAQFIADIQTLHSQNKKVLLSLGGANGNVTLNTAQDVTNFVQSVSNLIQQYGFDGIDIDIENNSFVLASGDNDFMNPKTATIVNMINALHQLATKFPGFMLTFAPQIEDVQEANVAFASSFGDQLPLLWGCRDIMSWVHVQDYNSGGTNALDGKSYSQGTADFLVAMTEMLVHGFTLANGQTFSGFPAGQVALGVPASARAASSGVATPTAVQQALGYLINGKSFGGQYVLQNASGYPGLRGVMTWSVNWDQVNGLGLSSAVGPFLHGLPAIPAAK